MNTPNQRLSVWTILRWFFWAATNPTQESTSARSNQHGTSSTTRYHTLDECIVLIDSRVPPNCRFEIDDFEQPWSYSQPFDYIHGRELEGAIRDHDQLFQRAFQHLKPNGWMEMATMDVNCYSDDETHLNATCMQESVKNLHSASRMFGKDMTSASTWKQRMEQVGFVNVREEIWKVCSPNPLPGNQKKMKLMANSSRKVHGRKTPS